MTYGNFGSPTAASLLYGLPGAQTLCTGLVCCLYSGFWIGGVDECRVPPHPPLALAPGVALQVGGGAVVHAAAVGRPRPAPFQVCPGHPRRVGLAPRRHVLVRRGVAAAVDPRRTRGRAVVLQLGEALEVLLRIGRLVTVDLAQDIERVGLSRIDRLDARIRVEL